MEHLKTNEEYKLFKGRKKSMIADWDITDAPENKRDWKEPFFNRNKPEYLRKKRDEDVLDLLAIPRETWNWFINNIKRRFRSFDNNFELWSERGTKGVNKDSYYYRVALSYHDEGDDDKIYFFPKEKKIVVVYRTRKDGKLENKPTKRIFEYTERDVRFVLSQVLEYLFTLRDDPEEEMKKRKDEYDQQKQRKYKELLFTDEELEEPEPDEDVAAMPVPEEIPAHRKVRRNTQDTSTFDSYNYKHINSFQTYEGMPNTLKHHKREGILDQLKKKLPSKKDLKKSYNKFAKNPLSRLPMPILSQK